MSDLYDNHHIGRPTDPKGGPGGDNEEIPVRGKVMLKGKGAGFLHPILHICDGLMDRDDPPDKGELVVGLFVGGDGDDRHLRAETPHEAGGKPSCGESDESLSP